MKKLLSISPVKIYMACGLSLIMTLGAFWHQQVNQTQLDRMNILSQGVSTCFNRISQTFTAMMIKDIQSPYLNRGFMGLSDECLNETIKGINPFRQNVGKGYETLNQLISEVHWFHEKVLKIHGPMLSQPNFQTSLSPLVDRYTQMENFKVTLMDEIDATNTQLKEIKITDEYLMGAGLIVFILAISLLSLQEFNRIQVQRELEKDALNYLNAGKANVGAIVDQLVDRALMTQGMPVTAQIFRDYHGELLERMSTKSIVSEPPKSVKEEEVVPEIEEENTSYHKTSLKEVLVSIQNIQAKDAIHMADVRDVVLNVPYESFEQMMNAAVNQLVSRRNGNKKVMISNQNHSDKTVVNLFLAENTFSASELEFAGRKNGEALADGLDMNLIILKEMVEETGAQWHIENKTDRSGMITGMNIRFTVNRTPKDRTKLVSVVRGKKKDLSRELMN